jgi:hypothetical protein
LLVAHPDLDLAQEAAVEECKVLLLSISVYQVFLVMNGLRSKI